MVRRWWRWLLCVVRGRMMVRHHVVRVRRPPFIVHDRRPRGVPASVRRLMVVMVMVQQRLRRWYYRRHSVVRMVQVMVLLLLQLLLLQMMMVVMMVTSGGGGSGSRGCGDGLVAVRRPRSGNGGRLGFGGTLVTVALRGHASAVSVMIRRALLLQLSTAAHGHRLVHVFCPLQFYVVVVVVVVAVVVVQVCIIVVTAVGCGCDVFRTYRRRQHCTGAGRNGRIIIKTRRMTKRRRRKRSERYCKCSGRHR